LKYYRVKPCAVVVFRVSEIRSVVTQAQVFVRRSNQMDVCSRQNFWFVYFNRRTIRHCLT